MFHWTAPQVTRWEPKVIVARKRADGVYVNVDQATGLIVGTHEHNWICMGGRNGLYRCSGCPQWAKDGRDADQQDARQAQARTEIGSR